MKHLNLRVTGRVQGVFFRASTKTCADKLGVRGMVRNESDGTVYIEAEGDDEVLQKFIAWCQQGPEFARVEQCIVEEAPIRHYRSFDILR